MILLQEVENLGEQGMRLARAEIARSIPRLPIHRTYNTRVSFNGALRYAWQALFGGGSMLKVGDAAPDFEVTDHQGRRVKLSDFRGKKVLLWFFPKADTPG